VKAQKQKGKGLGVVFADAFLRGMRDLGYKSPTWAMAEKIDNSIQAGADIVSINFGYNTDNKSQAKPDALAIIDNGNGMIAEMIGYAVRWGGYGSRRRPQGIWALWVKIAQFRRQPGKAVYGLFEGEGRRLACRHR
jgi:hypothetical protein